MQTNNESFNCDVNCGKQVTVNMLAESSTCKMRRRSNIIEMNSNKRQQNQPLSKKKYIRAA